MAFKKHSKSFQLWAPLAVETRKGFRSVIHFYFLFFCSAPREVPVEPASLQAAMCVGAGQFMSKKELTWKEAKQEMKEAET